MKLKYFVFIIVFITIIRPGGPSAFAQTTETRIPDCLLSYQFGPEQYVLVVEKSSQSLFVYSNYQPEPIETFKVTTGKALGQKFVEGDMKTPEGLYYFRRIVAGDDLPKVDDYGEKAFTLNYPNPIDRRENRFGSGIWLHGAYNADKLTSPNNSRGCVVMHNGDLVKVSKYIFLNQTPICVYDKIRYDTVENITEKRDRLVEYLKEWKTNWESKDISGYIQYYDDRFSYNRMNLTAFKNHKERLNKNYRFIKVSLSDINIYAYDDYFMVMFHQLYISDKNHFYSKKIQYWRDLQYTGKIAAEQTVSLPNISKVEVSRGNYISIDQFRKNQLEQLEAATVKMVPNGIRLTNISIVEKTVTLSLQRSGALDTMKVIPVLRLEDKDNSIYRSLEGVTLKNGVPTDFSRAVPMRNRRREVVIKKDEDLQLRSLTLFLVNRRDKYEQIITYFVNK